MGTPMSSIVLVILATIVAAIGPIYIKKGSEKVRFSIASFIYNKDMMIGVAAYLLSSFLFIPALKKGELSLLYPIVSLGYVWVALLSSRMLGERMSKMKWLAIVLILAGISFIGIGS